jgi:hypothetical protein
MNDHDQWQPVHWPLEYFLEKKNCEASSSLFGLIKKILHMFVSSVQQEEQHDVTRKSLFLISQLQ